MTYKQAERVQRELTKIAKAVGLWAIDIWEGFGYGEYAIGGGYLQWSPALQGYIEMPLHKLHRDEIRGILIDAGRNPERVKWFKEIYG